MVLRIPNCRGDLFTGEGSSLSWNSNAFLYYTRSFGNHNFNFSGGWEASAYNTENTSAQYRGFPSGQFNSLNYASEIYKKPTLTENTTRRVSILATLNYTWNDIYLADASVRFDGSSEFGANQKWAPFFSGGLGVNIHNYDFLKGNEKINKLKVRASYGRTGKVNFRLMQQLLCMKLYLMNGILQVMELFLRRWVIKICHGKRLTNSILVLRPNSLINV